LTIVIGLGNLLRADDGVGAHVVRRMAEELPGVEAVDLSTSDIDILDHIRGRDRVFIVDAIVTGAEPGTIRRLEPGELDTADFLSHGMNLSSVLRLGSELYPDEMPGEVIILAVEAEDISSFTEQLTEKVASAVPRLIEMVREELTRA
jgi:hydrogenase maturation protease